MYSIKSGCCSIVLIKEDFDEVTIITDVSTFKFLFYKWCFDNNPTTMCKVTHYSELIYTASQIEEMFPEVTFHSNRNTRWMVTRCKKYNELKFNTYLKFDRGLRCLGHVLTIENTYENNVAAAFVDWYVTHVAELRKLAEYLSSNGVTDIVVDYGWDNYKEDENGNIIAIDPVQGQT